jgi:hypothetical protein
MRTALFVLEIWVDMFLHPERMQMDPKVSLLY